MNREDYGNHEEPWLTEKHAGAMPGLETKVKPEYVDIMYASIQGVSP
ncbi:hypothetical protein JCM31598_36740 [Desulfonatronum parangueonense]